VVAGSIATLQGSGFQKNDNVSLLWNTVQGSILVAGHLYNGRQYTPENVSLGTIATGASGNFQKQFTIPYDYGGLHLVYAVGTLAGDATNCTVTMNPTLTVTPTSGPVGTMIDFSGNGFGWTFLDNTWHVNYDNHYVGWFSAITTKGNVTFSIPASGATGAHQIDVYTNPYGPTYLNLQEAFPEFSNIPRFHFVFQVTGGTASGGAARTIFPTLPAIEESSQGLTLSPQFGPVGTQVTASGSGFSPDEPIVISWLTAVGAFISPTGFANETQQLGTATANASGQFSSTFTIPSVVGAIHQINATGVDDGYSVNATFYVIRSATISSTSGPPGTLITINIYGVGWKSWENIATVDYDDGYTGYACALGEQPGNITITLTATGETGTHIIEVFPSIFRGPLTLNYPGGTEPDIYRLPLLTGNELPSQIPTFLFEFTITGSAPAAPFNIGGAPIWAVVVVIIVAGVGVSVFVFRGKLWDLVQRADKAGQKLQIP
jgi:hypothetical protein